MPTVFKEDFNYDESAVKSDWNWNKLFVPINQKISPMIPHEPDDFKYGSPFKTKPNHQQQQQKQKPIPALNPNAASFKMFEQKTDTETAMNSKEKHSKRHAKKHAKNPRNTVSDDAILAIHGFKKTKKIKDSLQGEIYEGRSLKGSKLSRRRVIIKKTLKSLQKQGISIQDGMNIVVDENIIKEAVILSHLTVDNQSMGSAICKLLAFFESSDAYYIIMEHGGNITLKEFVDIAHEHIKNGKLKASVWKKTCKYIGWQIAATLYWMHQDMNCAHLDLTLENIVINRGNFIENEQDGTVTVDRGISCKICDFGLAEIFKIDGNKLKKYFEYDVDEEILGAFHVNSKYAMSGSYKSPQIFAEEVFDGRKADIWSLGIILFYMSFGIYPYQRQSVNDCGYWSVKHSQINLFCDMQHLSHLNSNKLMVLIHGCLCCRESERFEIEDVIKALWFKTYFNRYTDKIKQQSEMQLNKNIVANNECKLDHIPYYKPQ